MDYATVSQFVTSQLKIEGLRDDFVAQRPATAVYARLLRSLVHMFHRAANFPLADSDTSVRCLQRLAASCSQAIAVTDPILPFEADHLRGVREQARQRLVAKDASA